MCSGRRGKATRPSASAATSEFRSAVLLSIRPAFSGCGPTRCGTRLTGEGSDELFGGYPGK